MAQLHEVLRELAHDRRAMQEFLHDSDAWISRHALGLADNDRQELRRVSIDLHRVIEYRCLAAFERSPEGAFVKGKEIGRRRLMLQACSVTLAALVGSLFSTPAAAQQSGQQAGMDPDPDLPASNAVCDGGPPDNGCENTLECRDEDQCSDQNCENAGSCLDNDCKDTRCNNHECRDSLCADDVKCTNKECDDEACMDVGGPGDRCTNSTTCGDTMGCIDSRCTNVNVCSDTPACPDDECNDLNQCSPNP